MHEIGEPGLMYGPREMRLYPNGRFASHVLGGTRFNNQSATNADMVGSAGIEATFDSFLSDRSQQGKALQLSLDYRWLRVYLVAAPCPMRKMLQSVHLGCYNR